MNKCISKSFTFEAAHSLKTTKKTIRIKIYMVIPFMSVYL